MNSHLAMNGVSCSSEGFSCKTGSFSWNFEDFSWKNSEFSCKRTFYPADYSEEIAKVKEARKKHFSNLKSRTITKL